MQMKREIKMLSLKFVLQQLLFEKLNCILYKTENRISLECKIHIAVFLQLFIKFNKVVYLTLPV